jgi:hypothetical protein
MSKKSEEERKEELSKEIAQNMQAIRDNISTSFKEFADSYSDIVKKISDTILQAYKAQKEDFDLRYEAYYPQMKAHLRKRLTLKKDEDPNMPISNDDMWQMWVKEIARNEVIGDRKLQRADFIFYHNLIEESLSKIGIKYDIETLAIDMTAKGKNPVCKEYLRQYIYRENKDLSANSFFKEKIDKYGSSEVGRSTFHGWVSEYKKNLEELRCAQE